MNSRFLLAALALGLFAGLAAVAPAEAYQRGRDRPDLGQTLSPNEARNAVEEGRHVPLRQILSQIEARYPGRMIGQRLEQGNPSIYVIDWLTPDGRKLIVRANAQTGAIIGVSG
ncbi:MAG: peptidase M4 [Alphaproteobacteria bacterium]|nr:peptidase M4 [Alphaproteobacteria bacterium]